MMEPDQHAHLTFMQQAFTLARRGEGHTSPNPAVGAVVVKDGCIVGEGYHPAAGQPHAEVFALRHAGAQARGATLYVTLEPCCHSGRTGPCTEAIITAGVKRVFAAVADPNPLVSGQGFARLRQAGVAVEVGLCADEGRRLIAPFAKHILTGHPHVTLKGALTLDGQLATESGQSQWITGPQARTFGHRLRHRCDAVMVGVGTVLADNPRLTTRLPEGGGKDPLRIVIDRRLRTPDNAAVLTSSSLASVLIVTSVDTPAKAENRLQDAGVEILRIPDHNGLLDLPELMRLLGARGIQSILLEGGGRLNHSAWHAGIIDRIALCYAPLLLGGVGVPLFAGAGCSTLQEARRISDLRHTRLGDDLLLEGEVFAPCLPA